MSYLIEAASELQLPGFVLDRPNPINGVHVEGKCQTEIVGSLVGRFPTPIRHGMTLGELALWLQRNHFPQAQVEVIACEGWKRAMWWDETGLPWVSPSPAMATLDTATVYCGTCLVEGTNLSEGRGTSHPFEWIGAPFADEDEVANLLNKLGLPESSSDRSDLFQRLQSTQAKFVVAFKFMSLTEMPSRPSEQDFALSQPSKASTRNSSLGTKRLLIA